MSDATAPIAAAAASAVVTSQAGFFISHFETWTRRHAILFVGFAAGVLFVIPLSHILPKALGIMPAAANFAPLGFFCAGHHPPGGEPALREPARGRPDS